ncbi:hypothetical protein SAMN05660330_04073 [Desulforhopalus singaporensis]|uniref:Uncharacterized protein n=2 Tax=Desulforhopalus singaporensis TaxID=91360 RepID=A0A1H0VI36_9BACT|nr:hypothetical protein SAMN05660330_04073 [Desulforhopalus singaporensis]
MQDAIVTIDEAAGTFTFNEKIMEAMEDVDKRVSAFLDSLTSEQFSRALQTIVEVSGAVIEGVTLIGRAFLTLFDALHPLGPMLVKVTSATFLLSATMKTLKFAFGLPFNTLKSLGVALESLTKLREASWLSKLKILLHLYRNSGRRLKNNT